MGLLCVNEALVLSDVLFKPKQATRFEPGAEARRVDGKLTASKRPGRNRINSTMSNDTRIKLTLRSVIVITLNAALRVLYHLERWSEMLQGSMVKC